jgi:cell division protein FtsB
MNWWMVAAIVLAVVLVIREVSWRMLMVGANRLVDKQDETILALHEAKRLYTEDAKKRVKDAEDQEDEAHRLNDTLRDENEKLRNRLAEVEDERDSLKEQANFSSRAVAMLMDIQTGKGAVYGNKPAMIEPPEHEDPPVVTSATKRTRNRPRRKTGDSGDTQVIDMEGVVDIDPPAPEDSPEGCHCTGPSHRSKCRYFSLPV